MTGPSVIVRVGELQVVSAPATLIAVALGSCIAVVMHDPGAGVGGLAHVLLPVPSMSRLRDQPGRFAQTAVPTLLERLIARGARSPRITARLIGGASMFTTLTLPGSMQMGERNVVAAREALHRHGVRLTAEAVGGDFGRTASFDVTTGAVIISSYLRGDLVL